MKPQERGKLRQSDRTTTPDESDRTTTMTPDEIQALRQKHHFCTYDDRAWGMTVEACFICGDGYPCDTIKVLDAWQNSTENGTEVTCTHCPKCGEELDGSD